MRDIYILGISYVLAGIIVFVALWVRMCSQVVKVEKRERKGKDEK